MEHSDEYCIHCSFPLSSSSSSSNEWGHKTEKVYEISSPQVLSSNSDSSFNCSLLPIVTERVDRVVDKIFKLDYLKILESSSSSQDHQDEVDEDLPLCFNCSQVLTNLYRLYNDFQQLGHVSSYLSKKMQKLNEIIQQQPQPYDISQNTTSNENNLSKFIITTSCSTQTPPVSIFFEGQPQIKLNRLSVPCPLSLSKRRRRRPQKYIQEEDDDFTDAQIDSLSPPHHHSNDDDDDLPVNYLDINIKIEENEWDPQGSVSKPKSKSKLKRTTKRTIKKKTQKETIKTIDKKLDVDLRDYLYKRTKYANPCWYCKLHFETSSECVDHTTREHLPEFKTKTATVCQRCCKISLTLKAVDLHRKRCEMIPVGEILIKPFTCTVTDCNKNFGSKKLLSSHMKSHTDERPFSCEHCPYKAKTMVVLNTHKAYQHPIGPEASMKIKCEECGIWTKNLKCLTSHKSKMHTPAGYRRYRERKQITLAKKRQERSEKNAGASSFCLDCNVDFFSLYGLTMHKKTFHPQHVDLKFVCDICGKSLRSASSLKTHLRGVHSNERPYTCEKCGKGFKHSSNLKDHSEQVHTEAGRLKYNEYMREKVKRRKEIQRQLHTQTPGQGHGQDTFGTSDT